MSPEAKANLIATTRSAAAAFIEDIANFRALLSRATDVQSPDIRRLSNELRRLLIDKGGDIVRVASPRIGPLLLSTVDNSPYYRAARTKHFRFFGSGGASFFGYRMRSLLIMSGKMNRQPNLANFDPNGSIDTFLAQKALCLDNEWVTRHQVIKYVAHKGHGVHSDSAKEPADNLIKRIRSAVTYTKQDPPAMPLITIDNVAMFSEREPELRYDPRALDPVLVELMATAWFLTRSPKVVELEKIIEAELGIVS